MFRFIPALISAAIILCGCTTNNNIQPVTPFDAAKFCGVWYKIAGHPAGNATETRFNFECMPNGKIEFQRREIIDGKNRTQSGSLKFNDPDTGVFDLKNSIFNAGKCYIVYLDRNYREAVIYNERNDELWILSRKPADNGEIPEYLIDAARAVLPDAELEAVEQQENLRVYNAIFDQE